MMRKQQIAELKGEIATIRQQNAMLGTRGEIAGKQFE